MDGELQLGTLWFVVDGLGVRAPLDRLLLANVDPVQRLARVDVETARSVLRSQGTSFTRELGEQRTRVWRRLSRAVLDRTWESWLGEFWAPVCPTPDLLAVWGAEDRDGERRTLDPADHPLLHGAARLVLGARNVTTVGPATTVSRAFRDDAVAAARDALVHRGSAPPGAPPSRVSPGRAPHDDVLVATTGAADAPPRWRSPG
jgi:hypothetical protein